MRGKLLQYCEVCYASLQPSQPLSSFFIPLSCSISSNPTSTQIQALQPILHVRRSWLLYYQDHGTSCSRCAGCTIMLPCAALRCTALHSGGLNKTQRRHGPLPPPSIPSYPNSQASQDLDWYSLGLLPHPPLLLSLSPTG